MCFSCKTNCSEISIKIYRTLVTKHIKTQVLVDNGGTVVIGGIYTEEQQDRDNKVPFFGDLPGLGLLFQNKSKVTKKSETLVFITPKLIN